jgi:hypothetical protein
MRKLFILLVVVLFISCGTNNGFPRTYFKNLTTGGTSTALDGIDGDDLSDGDRAIVKGKHYSVDADHGGIEQDPYLITPDSNSGNKRWVIDLNLASVYYADPTEADQGVVGSGYSVKDIVDAVGGAKSATIVFIHTGAGNTTTYTFTTAETITSNFTLIVENGALLDSVGAVTIQGTILAGAYQIFTVGHNITYSAVTGIKYGSWESGGSNTLSVGADSIHDASEIVDDDDDTGVYTEESADEDVIRFKIGGTKQLNVQDGLVEPTTDNDVDIGSLAKKFRHPHFEPFLGYADRARFSFKDINEVYIDGPAVYDVNGKWAYITSQLTSPQEASSGTSMQYLYIDYSAIPADGVIDSGDMYWGAGPGAYSSTTKGFYHSVNTDDRCVFGIPVIGSNIIEFHHDGGEFLGYSEKRAGGQTAVTDLDYTDIDVDGTWDEVYLIIPSFATKAFVTVKGDANADAGNAILSYRVKDATTTTGHQVVQVDATFETFDWSHVIVYTNTSQILEVKSSAAGDHTFGVDVNGFYFPRGM